MNRLFYGDNLHVLRDRAHFPDACVDLIYLDPPFNSKRDYNLLFKSPKGQSSEAQIEAFEDRGGGRDSRGLAGGRDWHWNEQAEREYDEIVHGANTDLAQIIQALRSFLGENDMMAYHHHDGQPIARQADRRHRTTAFADGRHAKHIGFCEDGR